MNKTFPTQDLDLAASIMAATGLEPEVERTPTTPLATFVFTNEPPVQQAALSYCSGTLEVNVKRFCIRRTWLYRQAKGGQR